MNDRPEYADLDSPNKFQAIIGIIMTRLKQHPNAICSYSGGSDSDILIDLIETARQIAPSLPPVQYVFFNTGLEMQAIKNHVKETAEKYGVEIKECRPKTNIVQAVRKYGVPFMSKIMSEGFDEMQKKGVPPSIADEYDAAEDKGAKYRELRERYPKSVHAIRFLCSCDYSGQLFQNSQLGIHTAKYMIDFISKFPPDFKISGKCCEYCKKKPAHDSQKGFEMVITGERKAEGGARASHKGIGCFNETSDGSYRFRPLYYVSDKDKAWYKERFGIRYSDAYEVYGLTRTGCCGCPISYKAVDDLEIIGKYEPNIVKAAWNIFGDSYRYRAKYNSYKRKRMSEEDQVPGQINLEDYLAEMEDEQCGQ